MFLHSVTLLCWFIILIQAPWSLVAHIISLSLSLPLILILSYKSDSPLLLKLPIKCNSKHQIKGFGCLQCSPLKNSSTISWLLSWFILTHQNLFLESDIVPNMIILSFGKCVYVCLHKLTSIYNLVIFFLLCQQVFWQSLCL